MKNIQISKEHKELIDKAVNSCFKTNEWNIVASFDRGLTSSSLYKISVNSQNYVARISDLNDPHNNLVREYNSMLIAAKGNVGPTVHYSNATDGIVIINIIEVYPLTKNELCSEKLSKKIGKFIHDVHMCKKFQDENLIFQRVEMIHDKLPLKLKENKLVTLAIKTGKELENSLSNPDDLRPSHADINPYNLLFNKERFYLVDWATAAQENLYFDLATCATFLYFNCDEAVNNMLGTCTK